MSVNASGRDDRRRGTRFKRLESARVVGRDHDGRIPFAARVRLGECTRGESGAVASRYQSMLAAR